jgi:hypothetical protein
MVSQFLPNNGMTTATAAYSTSKAMAVPSPKIGSGQRTLSPGGSSVVNKSKSPLRPRGRGRRVNSTSPTPPPRHVPFPFLKLPAEVRNQIYGYLLTLEKDLILFEHETAKSIRRHGTSSVMPNNNFVAPPALREWTYDNDGHLTTKECDWVKRYRKEDFNFIDRSLFLVNKQIYHETRGVLLANNTLSLMPMDLHAMAPARWNTMRQLTRYDIGLDIEAMPVMVDFLCSTIHDLRNLKILLVIPGFERTRCQYWVDKVKEMMEPLRDLHVRDQVEIQWIMRYVVDNPEVRREMVKWLEELGRDMMGGLDYGDSIMTGDEECEEECEKTKVVAPSTGSATDAPAPVVSASASATSVVSDSGTDVSSSGASE